MEACLSAHFVSRTLRTLGHEPRIIPAIHVEPFVKGQKNDYSDAEAIAEAACDRTCVLSGIRARSSSICNIESLGMPSFFASGTLNMVHDSNENATGNLGTLKHLRCAELSRQGIEFLTERADVNGLRAMDRSYTACVFRLAVTIFLSALSLIQEGASLAASVDPQQPKRVISINACTDQLLFALADREQIVAMTHYANDPEFSLFHEQIAQSGIELIRGSAEEVLKLRPDLVLAGTFTRHATRQRLEVFGVRAETFSPAKTVADAKADIRRFGKLIGQEARAEQLINDIDAMLHSARDAIPKKDLSVLQLRRNAYLAGVGTLFDDVLTQLGLKNAGRELGLRGTRQAHLEQILKIRPDVLVMFETIDRPGDQGSALLSHPALGRLYASTKRVLLPGNQIICGGPSLLYLLRSLKRGFATLDLAAAP